MIEHRSSRSWLMGAALSCAVMLAATSPVAAAGPQAVRPAVFSIDAVMSAPYPSDLAASPRGGKAAWVFDAKGVRNIWLADPASGQRARPVTAYTLDDGFDIADLAWAQDGSAIAYTRGQALEDERPANTAADPAGAAAHQVWMVATGGGAPRKIGDGHSPAISPAGGLVVFISGPRLMSAPLDGSTAPTPLIVDQGSVGSVKWSPDGARLVFVSRRGDHALVGVYDLAAKTITWMAPSLDQDQSPVFSPDGRKVAFIRTLAEKPLPFISRREGRPWSVWTADVATGEGRPAWTADEGRGSVFAETLSRDSLLWTAGDELIFPWEKTGWLAPYAVPAKGGKARALTTGDFETAYLALDGDHRRLVYASNQGDLDRMHVWTAEPSAGRQVPLAQTQTLEASPQVSGDGSIFALQSGATQPLQPVIFAKGRWTPLAAEAMPAAFPAAQMATPTAITFKAKDGQDVHAQIFLPKVLGDGPHPTLLFFHGGPRRQMLLGFHPMGAYNWMYAQNQYLASRGYIVLSVNYRGGIGYGLDYREAVDFGPGGGSEINDLLGAVTYLQGRKDVDTKRIGVWGMSYGGLMTAQALVRAPDAIAAGVDVAGVHDWTTFLASIGLPVEPGEATKRAFESSPVAKLDDWRSPMLLIQADDDRNVPSAQASQLIDGLRARKIDLETLMLPNEVHDMARYGSWMTVFRATDAYFERKLGAPTVGAASSAAP